MEGDTTRLATARGVRGGWSADGILRLNGGDGLTAQRPNGTTRDTMSAI